MMATILNSAILDSAILHKTLTQTILIWFAHNLIHSHSAWWWQPSWILPSWILPSWILPSWIQPFSSKKNVTHSFWLNLMMEAILNTAILDSDTAIMGSDTLLSSLRFTQKHSPSTLILTQTNWIWLTRWRQPSWILPSWIQPFEQKKLHSFILTQIDDCRKSWILLSWSKFSHFAQKKLHSFILTELDDGSHLEFCHIGLRHCYLGFRHLVIFSQIHSKTLFLHSDPDSN